MQQRRTIFLVFLALVCGSIAAWLAYYRVANPADTQQADNTTPVVVAAIDIPLGARLERTSLKLVRWPVASVPSGAITDMSQAEGKLVNQELVKDEPLTQRRLVEHLEGSTLAHLIEPEMRAITVRVNDVIGVAGFLLPGNRVDVVATRADRGKNRAETQTLLQNLKVLAVDQQARSEQDAPVVVRAVTLQVSPEQAEDLARATEEGTVQLVLRNPRDESLIAAKKEPEKPVRVRRAAPRPAPKEESITVIRGTTADVSRAGF